MNATPIKFHFVEKPKDVFAGIQTHIVRVFVEHIKLKKIISGKSAGDGIKY
jgi:hypothetical protein